MRLHRNGATHRLSARLVTGSARCNVLILHRCVDRGRGIPVAHSCSFIVEQNPLAKLRVMLVDESEVRRTEVACVLQSAGCKVVACLLPLEDLLDQVKRHRPDVVIIDVDLPNRDTLESLRIVQAAEPRPMVMFSQDDDGETIRRAVQAGVSAYVVDGIQAHRVRPILDAAIARFEQYRTLQMELDRTRSELADRKIIERAKGILMRERGIDEPVAYRLMRNASMDRNRRLIDIAESIVAATDILRGREPEE